MIYTYYSFKGGVGRSLALANVAEWYYRQGLRVVMIDWDLEAPGLESFFFDVKDETGKKSIEAIQSQLGLIDLLTNYQRLFPTLPLPSRAAVSSPLEVAAVVAAKGREPQVAPTDDGSRRFQGVDAVLEDHLPPLKALLYPIRPPASAPSGTNPAGGDSAGGELWLLPSGWRAGERFQVYAQQVQGFDWSDFYASFEGERYFEWLRRQLLDFADVVLIDSRTGVTEMGGVCARQLADVVVTFCAPNYQNRENLRRITGSFRDQTLTDARAKGGRKAIEVVAVPARVDNSENEHLNRFEALFKAELDQPPEALRRLGVKLWSLKIPYVPFYTYHDKLVVGQPDRNEDLEDAYKKLAAHLAMLADDGSAIRAKMSSEVQRVFGRILPRVCIAYAGTDGGGLIADLRNRIQSQGISLREDLVANAPPGARWSGLGNLGKAIDESVHVVIALLAGAPEPNLLKDVYRYARQQGKSVVEVAFDASPAVEPAWLGTELPTVDRGFSKLQIPSQFDRLLDLLRSQGPWPRIPFMAPDLPEGFVPRPEQFDPLKSHLIAGDHHDPVAVTTALIGAGGFGKTTIATALCHDEDVLAAFDDGILWVTLGEHPGPSGVLDALAKLYVALTGETDAGFRDVEEAAQRLAATLEDRTCLIVIDDAWNQADVRPFLRGGKSCARLITTRSLEVATDSRAKRVDVDGMTWDQSVALLTAQLDACPINPAPFRALAARLGKWPLMLNLAASALRLRIARGDTLDGALTYLNRALDRKGVSAFDRHNEAERHASIARTMEVSLDLLDDDDRRRCIELAIFPEEVPVPRRAISALWGRDEFDTEALVSRMFDLSLLIFDFQAATVRLHDAMRQYYASQLPGRACLPRSPPRRLGRPAPPAGRLRLAALRVPHDRGRSPRRAARPPARSRMADGQAPRH
jgi:cellulose biosynthesis protein BcsQ